MTIRSRRSRRSGRRSGRRVRNFARITAAIAISLLVALPDAAFAVGASSGKSLDQMSPQELDRHVQQLNESANWRKYRRASDPPDFVPGKPVKVMHGAGAFGRSGARGGSQSFRRSGLANRRSSRSNRGREDAMARDRGNSRSSRSNSSSRSSFGSSSRNSGSSFGNSNTNSSFDQ